MELRQLKYFLAVVDSGSLSKAAEHLYVAQSALSHQIAQLEEELGTSLLHRSSKGVSMTEVGAAFYEHAQAILRQVSDAKSVATQHANDTPSGIVVLGIPQSVSVTLSLPLFIAAKKAFPNISLQIAEELSGNLMEQLRCGKINLAILFDDGDLGEFACRTLVSERLHLLWGATDARRSKASRISLKDALHSPLMLTGKRHGIRKRIDHYAVESGIAVNDLVAEINSLHVLKSAVMAEIGATILPASACQTEIEEGSISVQEIVEPDMTLQVAICSSKNVPQSRATLAIFELVVQVVADLRHTGKWRDGQAT